MRKSRFTDEQIHAVVREVEAGAKVADVCRRHGISKSALQRWREVPGTRGRGGEAPQSPRGREPATQAPGRGPQPRQRAAQRRGGTKVMTAEQRRRAVTYLRERRGIGVTRACRLVGISRASCRYTSRRIAGDAPVRAALRGAAARHPLWGAPRLHWLLRRDGVVANHKRTERPYREEGLAVRRRRRKRLPVGPRVERPAPARPNERWSIDFVHDRLATGRAIRVLTVVDDCTRECPGLAVDTSLPSTRVIAELERLGALRGLPARLVCDHGSEFSSRTFLGWARARGIALDFIRPGKPVDNAYVESFNGKLRDECLNEQFFTDLTDARRTIERWRRQDNRGRPHRSLGQQTPAEYAARFTPDPDLRVLKRG